MNGSSVGDGHGLRTGVRSETRLDCSDVIHALILFMLRTASAKTSGLNQRSSGRERSLSKIGGPPRSSFEFARAFATLIRAKVKYATKRQAICTPGATQGK
jgi:hypothetical protein